MKTDGRSDFVTGLRPICFPFALAIPLDRQVKDWERAKFPMPKATLCNWILEVDKYYGKVLVEYMVSVNSETYRPSRSELIF